MAGSLVAWVEMVIHLFRHGAADSRHLLEIPEPGAGDRAHRAEMMQQGAPAMRADAGDLVELGAAERAPATRPVAADREPVRLVAQPLQVVEHRVLGLEPERHAV